MPPLFYTAFTFSTNTFCFRMNADSCKNRTEMIYPFSCVHTRLKKRLFLHYHLRIIPMLYVLLSNYIRKFIRIQQSQNLSAKLHVSNKSYTQSKTPQAQYDAPSPFPFFSKLIFDRKSSFGEYFLCHKAKQNLI